MELVEMFSWPFMQRALIAGVLVSLCAALLGVSLVLKRYSMRELKPDVWKFSVRTGERVNASTVCAELGGGGHAAAAGCTVEAPLLEAKRKMLDAVEKVAGKFTD